MKQVIHWFARCICVGYVFFGVATPAQYQAVPDSSDAPHYALQASIGEHFRVQPFGGGALSFRVFRPTQPDYRVMISVDGNTQHGHQIQETIPDSIRTDNRYTINAYRVRLIGQSIQPMMRRGPVTAYLTWGVTIPFDFWSHPYKNQTNASDTTIATTGRRNHDWSVGFGGQGNFGVTVQATAWLSWFVEYGFRAEFVAHEQQWNYFASDATPQNYALSTESTTELTVNPVPLVLGITIQF